MKRLLVIVSFVLLFLYSCNFKVVTNESKEEESFKPRYDYQFVSSGFFKHGVLGNDYLVERKVVKIRTTSGKYGYIFILDTLPIKADWVIFGEDKKVLFHKEGYKLEVGEYDLDGDGIYEFSVRLSGDMDFTVSDDSIKGDKKPPMFDYDFGNGVIFVTDDGKRVFGADPEGFEVMVIDEEFPTATVVFLKATERARSLRVGDVFFDVSSVEFLGDLVIREVIKIKDKGDYIVIENATKAMEDIIPAAYFKISTTLSEAFPINEDARRIASVRAEDHDLSYDGSKTFLDKSYATMTAQYSFGLDTNFDFFIDYSWDYFDASAEATLALYHDLIMHMLAQKDYKKSGETKPFWRPSFSFTFYGIPIIVTIPFYAGYEFYATGTAEATVGYKLNGGFSVGGSISLDVDWDDVDVDYNGYVAPFGDADMIGPEYRLNGQARLRGYIGIDVQVSLSSLADVSFINHPYIMPTASGTLEGDPYPDGIVRLTMPTGIDFSIKATYDFKVDSGKWEKHLKDWTIHTFGPWNFEFPAQPTNLKAAFERGTGVILTWTDNSKYEDGFLLYRKEWNGSSWEDRGMETLSKNTTSYTDSMTTEGGKYKYVLEAYADWPSGDRYKSREVSVEIEGLPPEKPSSPSVTPYVDAASRTPKLSWYGKDPSGDDLTYYVYLDNENPPERLFAVVEGESGKRAYLIVPAASSLNSDTEYFWKVVVKDTQGFEVEGDVWSFTTLPEGKSYVYVISYSMPPSMMYVAPMISGLQVWFGEHSMVTPATFLVDVGETYEASALYMPPTYPLRETVKTYVLFESWHSGYDDISDDNRVVSVTAGEYDKTLVAVANKFYKLTITATPEEGGSWEILGVEGEERNGYYKDGSRLKIKAYPADNYRFIGWYSGSILLSTDNPWKTEPIRNPGEIEARFDYSPF